MEAGGGETDASAAASEPSEQPTGFATLKGTFKLDGAAPPRAPIQITKDQSVCAPGGKSVLSESVVVGSDGGVANVLIYADDIPESWVHESAIGNTDEVEFDQKECVFLSHVSAIQTTQRLKILNSDPVAHNTKMEPRGNLALNQNIPSLGSITYPQQSGEMQEMNLPAGVSCSIHPWMNAWIIFRKDGYFAVTKEDGSFEIPNLPAGVDLQLSVWQEKINFVSDKFVTNSPAVNNWSRKGVITLRLEPDQEFNLDVRLSSSAFQ